MAQAVVPAELNELSAELHHAVTAATDLLDELREIARGIHPAILTEGGLAAALRALARRCPIPVDLDMRVSRPLPEHVEASAYYIVAEALTNVAKHSRASTVSVAANNRHRRRRPSHRCQRRWYRRCTLRRGYGPGGRQGPSGGDRRPDLFDSPLGAGTSLRVDLPLAAPPSALEKPAGRADSG